MKKARIIYKEGQLTPAPAWVRGANSYHSEGIKMVALDISITGKVPRETAEWLLKLLMILSDYFEFDVGGGFAEVQDEQAKAN